METKPEPQDVEMEGGAWAAHRDRCSSQLPAPRSSLGTGASLAGSAREGHPSWSLAVSGHLQTTRFHLSFCIADVFLKQLDVSELDRSALLRI